ncbi:MULTISPECIES: DUF6543 domain-containing protein [Pseudomonas]|uniref:Dermonecrotic toxin N-terminal domain-containing protein n=1 Tax=Pseudomonas putida TaxID=303 RepID=A0A7Y7Z934_PSEPU|nr:MULTISPECIES: DUF6543 domain-containing protein [Pseudomonas]NWC80083.1 hypothetical protein [Pseudomonas putida]
MTSSIRLPRATTLSCSVAKRFASRPTLFEIAAQLLVEHWPDYGLDTNLDPLSLQLASFGPIMGVAYIRPLYQVLVERYCLRRTLNLTATQDVPCRNQAIDPDNPVPVDLHAFETLVNDCGPMLLHAYRTAMVNFWCEADSQGQTPWMWFANHLQALLRSAAEQAHTDGKLVAAAATLKALSEDPAKPDDLRTLTSSHGVSIHTLACNYSANWQLDPFLASALLIERPESPGQPPFTLLFTPIGRLLSFASRQQLQEGITRHWPSVIAMSPPIVRLGIPEQQPFQAQAANLLQQQLECLELATLAFKGTSSAQQLADALDRLTSMVHLCGMTDLASQETLVDQLPDWMRAGRPQALIVYSSMLTDVARSISESEGQTWLDGVPNAHDFACERLTELILRDHPESTLDPAAVRVINYQTVETAIPLPGEVINGGTIKAVSFSLAQLAIANLGLLKPGRVVVQSADGQTIPAWLDTLALRALVTEADIGSTYPARLRALLLNDAQARAHREDLFAKQLSTQLPTTVMERFLEHGQPTPAAIVAIEQVVAPLPNEHSSWVMRPLGLQRSMDANADHPLNAWLIEDDSFKSARCLLYRPLHSEPVVEYSDRMALLVALSEPGELQNDVLQRLAPEDRRIYAHGGFKEPHLFYPLEDDWAVPLARPAPVTLSREAAVLSPARAIYEGCVQETLSNFKAQSASSAETRWQRWEELGWLLLNTVLPFIEGPLAEAAWLMQMETTFARLVDAEDQASTGDRTGQWIELLVNVALLIFNHAMRRLEQEHPLDTVLPLGQLNEPIPAPIVLTSPTQTQLEFSWAQPTLRLDSSQAKALAALQADVSTTTLGPPIPTGPMRGLYLQADHLLVQLEGKLFKAQLDPILDQMRIVGGETGKSPGPLLRRDEAGRWQLDLRLRLRGGMPPSKRIAKLQAQRKHNTREKAERVVNDSKSITEQLPYMNKLRELASRSQDPRVLRNCLEKLQTFEAFVAEHVQRLQELNELTPVTDYKVKRAGTLYQHLNCQLQIRELLMRLYKPERAHLLDMIEHEAESTPADRVVLGARLANLTSLIDSLLDNATAFDQGFENLRQLASPSLHGTLKMLQGLQEQRGRWSPLHWRFMRFENCVNRMTLELMGETSIFWLDRTWDSIELAIGQRLQLSKRVNASDEVRRRLLENIKQHLETAKRRGDILRSLFDERAIPPALAQLRSDIADMSADVLSQLAEYPDLPHSCSVKQLSQELPGLIETRDDGLLLGQPRSDDDSIVDIPGSEQGSVSRSYKRDNEQWVPVHAARNKTDARPPAKLKALLKESNRRLASARSSLRLMQGATASTYLPVEIEEILLLHRDGLDHHRTAIELRLTRDNQTDESIHDADAALSIKAIEDLSATLSKQAVEQRTRVALLQKPRMSELGFLLEHKQVQIRMTGSRRQLAKLAGRPDDYLEEYAISHDGDDLWYAHFHYSDRDAEQTGYTAGHLKTAAQRYARGRVVKDAGGHETEVHRSPIDLAAAKRYFFDNQA